MINRSIQEEAITLIKIHTPNMRTLIYINTNRHKGESNKNTEMVGYCKPLWHKWKISERKAIKAKRGP